MHMKNFITQNFQKLKFLFTRQFLKLCIVTCSLILSFNSYAQNAGAGGIATATTTIQSYEEPVKQLLYAIACVVGLVGAFNIYFKMQNGDQDVKKSIMMTIGGCVALVCLAQAIPLFFK